MKMMKATVQYSEMAHLRHKGREISAMTANRHFPIFHLLKWERESASWTLLAASVSSWIHRIKVTALSKCNWYLEDKSVNNSDKGRPSRDGRSVLLSCSPIVGVSKTNLYFCWWGTFFSASRNSLMIYHYEIPADLPPSWRVIMRKRMKSWHLFGLLCRVN